MKILYILLFLKLSISPVKANLLGLIDEFLQNNIEINKNQTALELSDLNYQAVYKKRSWVLSASSTHDNNNLDAYSRFGNRAAKIFRNSLSVQKDFIWGGSLSLANTLTSIKNDPASAPVFFGGPQKINQFGQTLTYKQALGINFLGRDNLQELKIAESNLSYNKLNMKNSKEQGVLLFYHTYLTACLNKGLFDLQKKALERAQKRSKLIKKRVRDGLRQRVDLLQVEMNEIKQQEEFKNASINLDSSMENLSNLLHRKVNHTELDENFSKKSPLVSFEKNNINHEKNDDELIQENPSISLIKEQLQSQKASLQRSKYNLFPKVEFFTQYSTDRYSDQISQAFSRGFLGNDRNQIIVGINVNFPLWAEPQHSKFKQAQTNFALTTLTLEKVAENIKLQEESLIKKLLQLEKNILSVEKRIKLAKSVLKQYNNLYRLGKRDLDQVINAEESLINTERSFIGYLVEKEKVLAKLASLRGQLLDILTKKQQ
ncbi:MAG: TolC family protein [Halobacteriovoraceae bacterium]|nr:TolC family protein [Halobacteriovoraceae bacterium]